MKKDTFPFTKTKKQTNKQLIKDNKHHTDIGKGLEKKRSKLCNVTVLIFNNWINEYFENSFIENIQKSKLLNFLSIAKTSTAWKYIMTDL